MAKGNERQNPEFDPTRIVRPTAAPVDLYFRPMLRGPEPSQLMQVAEALGGISPTLNRLASDAAAAGIAAEKNAGTWQAETEKDPEVLRRKATEAIEKAGGLAPWRFQSYLEAYGQREVRDKYRKALYENIDDLSNPYNADGTLRPVDYISQKMQEMYENVGLPTDSYYIQKGAAAARAEADNSFYDRLMNARRQKVIQGTEDTFMDGITFAIESNSDIDKAFAIISQAADNYYKEGGQNGDQLIAQVSVNVARGYMANKEFDRARNVLNRLLEPKKGDRVIGNRHRPELQQVLALVEDKEREDEFRTSQRERTLKDDAQIELVDRMLPKLQEMQAKTGFISMTDAELMEFVAANSAGTKASQETVHSIRGRVVSTIRETIEAMNRPKQRDRKLRNSVLSLASERARNMGVAEFFTYSQTLMADGNLEFDEVEQLRNINKQFSGMSSVDRDLANDRIRSIQGTNWTGLMPNQIATDGLSWAAEQGNRASSDVMSEWMAQINSQDFKNKHPDEAQRILAQDRILVDLVGRKKAEMLAQHKSDLERYNLTASFDATVGQQYSAEADAFVPVALSSLGMKPDGGVEYTSLASRASQILLDRIRSEWGSIAAEPGAAPLTLEQRRRELYRRIPDIKDRFYLELRNNPDSLGIPSQLSNIIKANTRPPAAGTAVGGVEGKVGALQPVSQGVGEFKSEGILARGAEYNAIFPSENDLVSTASETSRLANEARAVPEMRAKHDESKAKLGQLAEKIIQEMRTTSVRDINFGNVPKTLQRAPGTLPDLPLYEIRPDGVYVLSGLDGSRSPSPLMTRRYWAAKALTGYTQDEILGATTTEGVRIPKQNLDATEYLYFKSAQEFAAAVDEFTKSAGKSGIIADRYLPLTGMTFEEFRSAQFNLIGTRKPLTAAPPTIQE